MCMRYRYFLQTAVLLAVFVFICMQSTGVERPLPSARSMRVVVILPSNRTGGYWEAIRDGCVQGAEDTDLDLRFDYPQKAFDSSEMAQLIRQAAAARADAIVAQGIDDPVYIGALQAARDQGILIGFVDTDISDFEDHLYVGTDNYGAGLLMAEHLVELTGGDAGIGVIMASPNQPNLVERLNGFSDGIAGQKDMEILRIEYSGFDAMAAVERYYAMSQETPSVDTLICLDAISGMTFGSLSPSGKAPPKCILCFDVESGASGAFGDGVVQGAIVQQPREMGRIAAQELYRRFSQGSYSAPVVYTGVLFVPASQTEKSGHGA